MSELIDITVEQLDNMKHAIGYEKNSVKKAKYEAYRNYYATGTPDESWEQLVRKGYAQRSSGFVQDIVCYRVSEKGIFLLEIILDIKIVEE